MNKSLFSAWLIAAICGVFACIPTSVLSQSPVGDWSGKLAVPGAFTDLDVSFHFSKTDSGFDGTMSILQQGLNDHPIASTQFSDSILTLDLPEFRMTYQGKLAAVDSVKGRLFQAGYNMELNLTRGKTAIHRPQEPQPPFSYTDSELEFRNEGAGLVLSGTLMLPLQGDTHPLVVILSGSGPQDRDGHLFGHKPYLVLADHLAENGIAVFRYDERGVGASQGQYEGSRFADHIADAEAALTHLKSTFPHSFSHLGLIGHSSGGILASQLAADRNDINFLVLLATPGVKGTDLMLRQKTDIERAMDIGEPMLTQSREAFRGAYNIIAEHEDSDHTLSDSLNAYFSRTWGASVNATQTAAIVEDLTRPELMDILRTDPSTILKNVQCPVLAVNGSKDLQVAAEPNLTAIKTALIAGGNKKVTTVNMDELNHLFQKSHTGLPAEYSTIQQTLSPEMLSLISNWIGKQVR